MRAGIENKEMVSLLGIDIHRLFTVAFALGAFLAGIAGALTAPIRGLSPGMGVDMLGIAFVVVALGGLGNLLGAIAAGLLIGVAQARGRGVLDRGLHRGDLRGDGGRAARSPAGTVRHPMKKKPSS